MGNNGGLAIGQLRISLAQINPTLGDLTGNSDLILEYAAKASAAGAHVLLFPEMVITEFPAEPKRLNYERSFHNLNAFMQATFIILWQNQDFLLSNYGSGIDAGIYPMHR